MTKDEYLKYIRAFPDLLDRQTNRKNRQKYIGNSLKITCYMNKVSNLDEGFYLSIIALHCEFSYNLQDLI